MSIPVIHPAHCNVDGIAVIGRTLHDLRGIRHADGDDGGAPTPTPPAADTVEATVTAGEIITPADSNAPWTKENFDPERAWKRIENMQADAAAAKTKTDAAIAAAAEKAQKDTLAQFAKLLTGEKEAETDPVKLAAALAEQNTALSTAQQAAKTGALNTQVAILAPGLGASAKLLLNNEQFKTSVASVEPTDEAAITAAIKTALQANAALKATPPRSGSGEHQGATVQTLETQLKAATEKKDFVETIRLKQAIAAARKA